MSAFRWRRGRSTGYHYYENERDGIGYVQRASKESGGGWLAVCLDPPRSDVKKTLVDGKRFVEKAARSRRRR